jgi:Fe-S-cluster-containing dehydrogenase component/formate-dependent nitrite reductase membrane component NrfD
MQLGFVIDQTRCIGCHACTVACKAENEVPLGSFRTWVKYTEEGSFPRVRRSFTVLRCNQCTNAPCVHICPVRALDRRPDGIVDIDRDACIGCKACMQGCPYDALYLDHDTGVAAKCHFCAHRVERGLAPACAVVCPTEAIVPGDFHDPESRVARLRREHDLRARKPEAGTGPNVWYLGASEAGLDPGRTTSGATWMWAARTPEAAALRAQLPPPDGAAVPAARTAYDVDHPLHWGRAVSAYLFTKSIAAGAFLVLPLLPWTARGPAVLASAAAALLLLAVTAVLLVADLERPERFLYVVLRPNLRSWLARGAFVLTGYGLVATAWTAAWAAGTIEGSVALAAWVPGAALAALAAAYTGWLFAQAKGRVLWMRRHLAWHLVVQAWIAGTASALLLGLAVTIGPTHDLRLRLALVAGLVAHAAFLATEGRHAPRGREREYEQASRVWKRGPLATRRRVWVLGLGVAAPIVAALVPGPAWLGAVAGVAALAGLAVDEDLLVRAGQLPEIS